MRLFGLIGFPLEHSFSEGYFRNKFLKEGITDAEYRNFPLARVEELSDLTAIHTGLCGLNVTIPYKQTIIPFLYQLHPEASEIGAVNCIKLQNGKWMGLNTDAYGFAMSIKPFIENYHERAFIFGAGGASKAVAYVLKRWGIQYFHVVRKPSEPNHIAYADVNADSLRHYTLLINTTPLGMYPDVISKPDIPYEFLTERHFCYDLVYNPTETAFMHAAKSYGAKVMNGQKMLELQAERSWQIWNDPDV